MLDMLMLTTGSIIAITVFAMTFLYQQTFMEEEASDIAMLKSLGVDRTSIRRWQYERILLLVVIAALMATAMSFTVSRLVFGKIGEAAMGVAEFHIAPPGISALLSLSLGLICIITIVLLVSFKTIDRIKIWRVRNE
jgi:ABC-type antimicrobial peptide transport system permease subunit